MKAHEIEVAGERTVNASLQHEVAPVSAVVAGETPSLPADTKVVSHPCTHTHRNAHTEKEAAEEEQAAAGKTEDEEAEKRFRTLREESPGRLGKELATEQQARQEEEDVHRRDVLEEEDIHRRNVLSTSECWLHPLHEV
jgi:hypothetical protein